jgi:Signal transduction histidine kinase
MKQQRKKTVGNRLLVAVWRYVTFFSVMAFSITGCMILFLRITERELGLIYTEDKISHAAVLTFINIVLLSMFFTILDGIRRRYTVERPVERIISAAERIMRGEFSVRIKPFSGIYDADGFNTIIAYFNKMAGELSGIETLRTDFISNVSHELKTPLAVIQNYGTMLQSPNLSEERRLEYSKAVTESSRRLADLITNILKLNRLENQQIYPEHQTYNLGEQLCECLLGFENVWEKKEIDIDTDIEEDVFIESDAELLTLVWNNLFSNAMKFTEQRGCVSLTLKSEAGYAVVQVADNGCGISPDTGKHIFEKFYQGDTSHSTQGNGLGLALVKRVVDIVGGDISVQSEVGKGSIFTVKLRRKDNGTV